MAGKKKILVVDDDPVSLELMEAILLPNGYSVVTASDGRQGLEKAVSQQPDIILLDIMMPGMDGYSTLTKIKETRAVSNIPVIMLTAVGFELNKELATRLGASGYITKPVDLQELLKTLSKILAS
jgi:CheY-like chemotaxis protein